jgi:hypothetical protein
MSLRSAVHGSKLVRHDRSPEKMEIAPENDHCWRRSPGFLNRGKRAIMESEKVVDVHLEIPEEFARQLASDPEDMARLALEALAAEGVRSGKLSTFQARRLLGIQSRYEMDGFLKAHGVYLDVTLEDVRKDSDAALSSSR